METGPAVLLLHGIGLTGTSWEAVVTRLGVDYRIVAPDLPGYGDAPDWDGPPSLDALVRRFAGIVKMLRPVHIVGVSFGALLALAIARRMPDDVRSLVLSDATLGRASLDGAALERWRVMRERLARNLEGEADRRAAEIASPNARHAVVAAIAASMRRARANGYRAVASIVAETDATTWLNEVRAPALVLCGDHDTVTGAEISQHLATALAGARVRTIANAGHAPHVEQPDAFVAALRAFWNGTRPA